MACAPHSRPVKAHCERRTSTCRCVRAGCDAGVSRAPACFTESCLCAMAREPARKKKIQSMHTIIVTKTDVLAILLTSLWEKLLPSNSLCQICWTLSNLFSVGGLIRDQYILSWMVYEMEEYFFHFLFIVACRGLYIRLCQPTQ